ncbi:MAG: DUF5107 domain-containing protein [Chloroflexota bacterium]
MLAGLCLAACRRPTSTPAPTAVPATTPSQVVVQASAPTATPCVVTLLVASTPVGAEVWLDGALRGTTPLSTTTSAGQHSLRLHSAGHAPATVLVQGDCGRTLTVDETLRDNAPPEITLDPLPSPIAPEDGLKIVARAADPGGVAAMTLLVDGRPVHRSAEGSLRYNLDTRDLAPGEHVATVQARDLAGNTSSATARWTIAALVPSPTNAPTGAPAPTGAAPSATPPPSATPSRAATSSRTVAAQGPTAVTATWAEIVLRTYAYEQALYTAPDKAGHPYPLLKRDQVGPPLPRTYRAIVLRNEYLELTLLPDLGGRLYQARYLPTGQTLFYNNPVIKPTHWGPEDQGWWLAAGGMEFCLPVAEHGYLTALPWTPDLARGADGSATVTMSIEERTRGLVARVGITLRPGAAAIEIASRIENRSGQAQRLQYWINAMLAPGAASVQPTLRFYYPAREVVVHSRSDGTLPADGQRMAWPVYAGRDLSRYAAWPQWLGVFAPQLASPYSAVYDEASQIGVVRAFPPEVARGVKLFAFGPGFGAEAYTDDGSRYIEMWGGWTPTFLDDGTLAPGELIQWAETWYPITQIGGVSAANAEAALYVAAEAGQWTVRVASPRAYNGTLSVRVGGAEVLRQAIALRPDRPYRSAPIAAGNQPGRLSVHILDGQGATVLAYEQ